MVYETIEELENKLIEIIIKINTDEYNFKTSELEFNSSFGSCGKRAQLRLYLPLVKNFKGYIEFSHHLIKDNLVMRIYITDDEDEYDDSYYECLPIKIPRTEEQYFQYYTIQDNVFSLEFYNILEKTMSKLLVKWQSG